MANKTAKPTGRFVPGANARNKIKRPVTKSETKKASVLTHDQMIAAAKKSPPPQAWFEEDFSKLRGPKA